MNLGTFIQIILYYNADLWYILHHIYFITMVFLIMAVPKYHTETQNNIDM